MSTRCCESAAPCTRRRAATRRSTWRETVRPALVILDVDLPRVTGYEVCRELRDTFGEAVAIMFVSGTRAEALDRIAGLLIGADDYVLKPFDPDELVNRVRALLRRQPGNGPSPDRGTRLRMRRRF